MSIILKKRNRNKIIYSNCEIPAKLFYNEVIGKSNLSVLGNGTPEELNTALYRIIDELTELEDNKELLLLYNKRMRVSKIKLTIAFIEESLYQIAYLKLTDEERLTRINRLNNLPNLSVKFDVKKPITEEIARVQKSVIGMLRNRLNMEQEDEEKKTDKAVTSFEEMTVFIFKTTGYKVTDTDTLRTFAVYKKDAIKTNQQLKAQSKKHGK